jgi:hypothetical protein
MAAVELPDPGHFADWLDGELARDIGVAMHPKVLRDIYMIMQSDRAEYLRIAAVLRKYRIFSEVRVEMERECAPDDDAPTPEEPSTGKTFIVISTAERKIADRAITQLVKRPDIYERAGMLVRITRSAPSRSRIVRHKGAVRIDLASVAQVRSLLADCIEWRKPSEKGLPVPAHPPVWACQDVHTRGQWPGIKPLIGVTDAPLLRDDGTVLSEPGYDEPTGLYLTERIRMENMAPNPSRDQAIACYAELAEVFQDFPLPNPHHLSACIAGILTPIARYAFEDCAPMFIVDANVRGAGKGLLTDVIALIASGHPMARMPETGDTEEDRKRITSIAMEGDRFVLLDNITKKLGNAALDAALTSTEWTDRLMGTQKMVSVPLLACWYVTGNNVQLRGDTARRALHIRLESNWERPEERQDFHHADLRKWVRRNRGRLLGAALTILQAYFVADCPQEKLVAWGSFQPWSDLVRQAIVWCDRPDPGLTRGGLTRAADTEASELESLIGAWESFCLAMEEHSLVAVKRFEGGLLGLSAQKMAALASSPTQVLAVVAEGVREALQATDRIDANKLGYKLRRFRERPAGNKRFVSRKHSGANYWCVQTLHRG